MKGNIMMGHIGLSALVGLMAALLAAPSAMFGDTIVPVPPGLAPGTTYRLVFVTSETRQPSSAQISDYDTFVTTSADDQPLLAALGTTWQVIGSTASVSASDHIGVFFDPVYDLEGDLVANGSAGLWSGTLDAPVDYNELGLLTLHVPFTGSTGSGGEAVGNTLGTS